MTDAQKLDLVTGQNGEVNLNKLRQLEKKQGIQPLERIDHTKLLHKPFFKNFYFENPEVQDLSTDDVALMRKAN